MAILAVKGVELPPGKEARVFRNSADTFHIVMPEDPNLSLDDDEESGMIGGGKARAGSAGGVGVAGTLSTVVSSASSVSSVGTAGSAAPG